VRDGDPGAVGLSVVIVSWNTRELLGQCLASIEAHPPRGAYEVWVVDNASADGSAAMVRERFPWARLIENEENRGFAAANNQAIRQSASRYVLLLNSDTEVQPGALPVLVAFMDARGASSGGCFSWNRCGTGPPTPCIAGTWIGRGRSR
jgi:GT2 family glycosyltransferase